MAATFGSSAGTATVTITSGNAVVLPGGVYVFGSGLVPIVPPGPPSAAPLAQVIDARGRFEQRARQARGDA